MQYILSEEEYRKLAKQQQEKVQAAVTAFCKSLSSACESSPDIMGYQDRVTFEVRFLQNKLSELQKAIEP